MSFFNSKHMLNTILSVAKGSLLDNAENITLIDLINKGIAFSILAAGFLSVVFIFIGGISFILSGGESEKITSAVDTIRYAIIGLIVTVFAVIIVNSVGQIIGINTIEYIKFSEILDLIKNIGSGITGSQSGSGPRTLNYIFFNF